MDWDSYESVDVRGAISKVGHILNGRDLDGKKRPLGPVNMRPLRYLMLLYLAKMSPKYKDMGKAVNNHLYFSTPHLDKVASDMNPQLEFDRKRCLEVYEKYSKAGLVDIVEENHVTRVGITEAGETKCLENLEDLMSNEYPSEKDHFFRPKVVALKTPVTTNEAVMTIDVYLNRNEIKPLFNKYRKFYGRIEEIKFITHFLENDQQILIVTGDGGVGKTRLILESILHHRNRLEKELHWHVLFINPYKNLTLFPEHNKILFILDDAKRYSGNLDLLLDYVINPPNNTLIKIILIERPYFIDEIINSIQQKNSSFQKLEVYAGDVEKFLTENYSLDHNTASEIELKSRGSFDYAASCAEYYRNGGKMDDNLLSILSWKIERYVSDISRWTGYDISTVKYYLQMLSLIMPVSWKNDWYFLQECFSDIEKFKKILLDSRDRYDNNLIFVEDDTFIIKPDPIADYLRLALSDVRKGENILLSLFRFFPYRILYNMISVRKLTDKQNRFYMSILGNCWQVLNENKGYNEEYFEAIELLSAVITQSKIFVEIPPKINIDIWVESFEDVYPDSPPKEITNLLISSFFNAFVYYADIGYYDLCERIIGLLNRLFIKYGDVRFEIFQGAFLETLGNYYVKDNQPEKFSQCILEIKTLFSKYPSDLRLPLASILVKSLSINKPKTNLKKALHMNKLINEIKVLYDQEPSDKMAKILCSGLVLSIEAYLNHRLVDKAISAIDIVKELNEKHSNEELTSFMNSIEFKVSEKIRYDLYYRNKGLEQILVNNGNSKEIKGFSMGTLKKEFQDTIHAKIAERVVPFDIHQILNGLFVFVLNNEDIPKINLVTEFTIHDFALDSHVFINIVDKINNENVKTLAICPFRVLNDLSLQRMVNYLDKATRDPLTDLLINKAMIGITNQKGFDMTRIPHLTTAQRDRLMLENDCMVSVVSKGFPTMCMLSLAINDPILKDKNKRIDCCPYCTG